MAKIKNFTLRIDAHLLAEFLGVCHSKDQTASAVVRESMRNYVRRWRRNVAGGGGLLADDNDADDDLCPQVDEREQLATLRRAAAAAKRKRLAAEQRVADHRADAEQRIRELKNREHKPG
jgi:hypothetical protein